MNKQKVENLARLLRYYSLTATTKAGSGHPTSCLSAADAMSVLFFAGHFRYDIKNPKYHNNDRLIFSKGHAAPLFYAMWAAAGAVSFKELLTLREFTSPLEGHPTMEFPYTEVATGSLGQGLSVGVGMAINAQYLDKLPYHTYVLLGDSEMAEGSNWEAMQLASYYKLDSLIGILDINRLGQRGQTISGHKVADYEKKCKAFGWKTIVVNGHNLADLDSALSKARKNTGTPMMIICKTYKGNGISFLKNKEGWHGKALDEEQLVTALEELGPINFQLKGSLSKPLKKHPAKPTITKTTVKHDYSQPLATRKAYGHSLVELGNTMPNLVALDAETSNSTYAQDFAKAHPERFFEMFIAEQNMVGVAAGLSARGKKPFVSTFSAFFTRAHDQIRLAQYSNSNITFVGSHAGVSIGEDGASQMGLEDISQFRALLNSIVLYPSDHYSQEKLTSLAAKQSSLTYIRTTRMDLATLYSKKDDFKIGGSKTLKKSSTDDITLIGAGITTHEILQAHNLLKDHGVTARVIDLYSIKPLDIKTLMSAVKETKALIVVEDHFAQGGIGEAVMSALGEVPCIISSLAVSKMPHSGTPEKLLNHQNISAKAITKKAIELLS